METTIEVPLDWVGTIPEYLVFVALTKLGIEFEYQSSKMGGRMEKGGSVLDFYIPDQNLGINIASMYWHYQRPEGLINDQLQREALEAQGIRVVYIYEDAALRNARWYCEEALEGRDHSLMARGI